MFPPSAVETDRKIHEAREKARLDRERIEVAQELRTHRSSLRRDNEGRDEADRAAAAWQARQDTVARATTEKLGELIGAANSVDDLRDIQHTLSGAPGGFSLGSQNGQPALNPGSTHRQQALPAGGDGLSAVLSDLVSLTQFRHESKGRRVRGLLLRLVAEAVADDSLPASGAKAGLARQARAEIAGASLPADQQQALHEFADPMYLHGRLYP
jgi:hypothetical protein